MNERTRSFLLPDLGEGLTEAEVLRWLVAAGETVSVDQPVAEVETAKSAVELPTPYAGRIVELHAAPGDTVAVGAPLISVAEPVPAAQTEPSGTAAEPVLVGYGSTQTVRRAGPPAPPSSDPRSAEAPARIPVVSPVVRRMAREHGIDLAELAGSGPGGLVLRRDVEAALTYRRGAADAASPARGPAAAPTGPAAAAEAERVPLRGTRRAAAERFLRARREIPEATIWVDADATELLAARRAVNAADPDRPVSLAALVARFCVLGLRRFPALNAAVDTERGEIVRFAQVHLGFAAQTPRGLLVPVVRGAERMTARELSAALAELAAAARAGTLPPDRLAGGTFTVNNYGVFGVDGSAAIIPYPQAAMVGLGRIVRRPWVVGDTDAEAHLAVRHVTELTLAFDHRVCDGEEAAGFLRFVADCVERPGALLGEV